MLLLPSQRPRRTVSYFCSAAAAFSPALASSSSFFVSKNAVARQQTITTGQRRRRKSSRVLLTAVTAGGTTTRSNNKISAIPRRTFEQRRTTFSAFYGSNQMNSNNQSHHQRLFSSSSASSSSLSANSNKNGDSSSSTSTTTSFSLQQELTELKSQFEQAQILYKKNLKSAGVSTGQLQDRIRDLELEQSEPTFWDESNTSRAKIVHDQLSDATRLLQRLENWHRWYGDAQVAWEILLQLDDDKDQTEKQLFVEELQESITLLQKDCQQAELDWLLSGPYDDQPARMVITAGAGGTEANDWVDMLARMYTRFTDSQPDFSVQVVEQVPGDVVGSKSVELLISGRNAYGWLQGEKGAHRLVRLSPFNANNKRQTTFAGVDVYPDLDDKVENAKTNDIPMSDLDITTMKAGGKGGQNVNKVETAVRIKHIPTNIQVKSSQERSQSQNKEIAMNLLKAKLLTILQEQKIQEINEIRGDMVEASWGAQIRNYVLHPYSLVKDQRTNWETSNAQAFLDGEHLDDCIGTFLRHKAEEERRQNEQETG